MGGVYEIRGVLDMGKMPPVLIVGSIGALTVIDAEVADIP